MNHIKTDTEDYYIDDRNLIQGVHKSYHGNGKLRRHGFYIDGYIQGECKTYHDNGKLLCRGIYVDGKLHGEYKLYRKNGKLATHCFYLNRVDVADEVKSLVSDIMNITDEEKLILKLQLGLDL